MRPSLRSIPVCIDGVIPSCPGVASLRVEGLSIQSGASSTRTWDTATRLLERDLTTPCLMFGYGGELEPASVLDADAAGLGLNVNTRDLIPHCPEGSKFH